jgi:hypothetical protein
MRAGSKAGFSSISTIYLVFAAFSPTLLDGALQALPLTLPGQKGLEGILNGPTAYNCYNLTFSDEAIRELVWWEQGRSGSPSMHATSPLCDFCSLIFLATTASVPRLSP